MGLGNIANKIMKIIPYKAFVSLYSTLQKTKFRDAADSMFYEKCAVPL